VGGLETRPFPWISVLQIYLFCTYHALAQYRFGYRNPDETNNKGDGWQPEKIMEEFEPCHSKNKDSR
jgi:hypothetical protein